MAVHHRTGRRTNVPLSGRCRGGAIVQSVMAALSHTAPASDDRVMSQSNWTKFPVNINSDSAVQQWL